MKIIIRKAAEKDMPHVFNLIKELAVFEKAPNEVTNTVADMIRDGFGKEKVFDSTVAELDGEIVGMAVYHFKYSTWKGKGVYLDDIIVTEKHRNKGIGKLLFEEVIRYSKSAGAKQLHWQVLDWNEAAISFYRKYNPSFDSEWINCKLSDRQMIDLLPHQQLDLTP